MTDVGGGGLQPDVEARARQDGPGTRRDDPPPTLAEVYERHADFVWRIARRMGIEDAAVEDVMHDVFVIVHRRLPEFDGRAAMSTWLYHITRGVVANRRRGQTREARRLELVRPTPGAAPDPERETARKQAADFVRSFVAELDEDKRRIFELADIEGIPVAEAARLCGIKLNTAYSRLRAARQRFQRAVDGLRSGARSESA